MYRTTDRHTEQQPRARILAGARAQMLVDACARTNKHTEVRARMFVESLCTDARVNNYTDVSTDSTGVYTESTDVHKSVPVYFY